MTTIKSPMTDSYKAVFVFAIVMSFVTLFAGGKGGIGTLFWGYVAWMMHKRNNTGLVSVFKLCLWLVALSFFLGFVLLSNGTFEEKWFGYSAQGYYLTIVIVGAIDFALLKYFENQELLSSSGATQKVDHPDTDQYSELPRENVSKSYAEQQIIIATESSSNNNESDIALSGDESWNLAIKYDPDLKNGFIEIFNIDPKTAQNFKNSISENNAFNKFKEIQKSYLKEALGLNHNQTSYFKNKLLNEVTELLVKKNSLAANEFIKLVKLYDLENVANLQDGVPKILTWLHRVEDQYKITVSNELTSSKDLLPDSNTFQIKYKLYEEFNDLDHVCLKLRNGNCAIVRKSEYRIYNSKESAEWALAFHKNNDQWTMKNLVDRLDIEIV
jgi:hypothetical protein